AFEQLCAVIARQLRMELARDEAASFDGSDELRAVHANRGFPPCGAVSQAVGVRVVGITAGEACGVLRGTHPIPTELRDAKPRRVESAHVGVDDTEALDAR